MLECSQGGCVSAGVGGCVCGGQQAQERVLVYWGGWVCVCGGQQASV